ncbi:uncharacterized protein EV154DRAFT_502133 [Mucor mucedo]|uniref:uncharacterized protein n=1 Tax=Mucor mucedo TaxID=29922 RepID=UPI00221FF228|nr:uncharacterized protein EV154DRAFT_531690 [Mucor mucedo]XP_051459872.1 uncharacterized protein EV154DRAFT_502133 [Mucor mucedo]KAI7867888.1 hypothetical protein EV154DRAFT_531690 [Mucor mucedo]KAI7893456.1 hypothetical protein EV154DRAFT_502133 [Mucor mucedo]
MSLSVADIFEDYLESLQNLPSEIDQNMHELRRMDDDLQIPREYTRHKRSYIKQSKALESTDTLAMVSARLQLEKIIDGHAKTGSKIELAMRMYDLVMTKSNLNKSDWIRKGPQRKRLDGGIRKRTARGQWFCEECNNLMQYSSSSGEDSSS